MQKIIEGKNETQLKVMEDQGKKTIRCNQKHRHRFKTAKDNCFLSTISEKAKRLMKKIKTIDDWLDTAQLVCTKTDGKTKYDFNNFAFPSELTLKIYHCDLMLQEAEDDQQELKILISKLNNDYNPKSQTKIK